MGFIIRLLVHAAALWVATRLVPGVVYTGGWLPFLGVALVFGFVNAFVAPLAKLITLPFIVLTLGVFSLVVNALMLWLTSELSRAFGLGFHVRGFQAAFMGALVVGVVSFFLTRMVEE